MNQKSIVLIFSQKCTCLFFQDRITPCWHVIKAHKELRTTENLANLVSELYKTSTLFTLYSKHFIPVLMSETTRENVLPPVVTRARGRPPTARRLGVQDFVRREVHCSRCEGTSHYANTCPLLVVPANNL